MRHADHEKLGAFATSNQTVVRYGTSGRSNACPGARGDYKADQGGVGCARLKGVAIELGNGRVWEMLSLGD